MCFRVSFILTFAVSFAGCRFKVEDLPLANLMSESLPLNHCQYVYIYISECKCNSHLEDCDLYLLSKVCRKLLFYKFYKKLGSYSPLAKTEAFLKKAIIIFFVGKLNIAT